MNEEQLKDAGLVRDSSYRFQGGVWSRIPLIEWTKRTVQRWVGNDQPMREVEEWAPAGYELLVALEFGYDWGIKVKVRMPEQEEETSFIRLPLLASVSMSDSLLFDVLCPDMPDVIALVNQLLPLIQRQQEEMQEEDRSKHFGHRGHLAEGRNYVDCEWCLASKERQRENG